jgi:lipoate-protein ligase A
MALDQALLEFSSRDESRPVLRLYSWAPPCLSIGYAQPTSDVDLSMIENLGWDIVRRPTGGRAILHTDELTYSVTMPLSHPLAASSVLDSYRRLSFGLVSALNKLGLVVNADKIYPNTMTSGSVSPVCFEAPSNYEITVAGKKLIGSAQARRNGALLQHGSLPLFGDLGRITKALQFESIDIQQASQEKLFLHAATLETVLGKRIDWETAAQAFRSGFSEALNIEFITDDPHPFELERAEELMKVVYTDPSWTFRL